ncbi:MAG: anthranilate synthase component I [Bacillota bacterium]|nr:anthranilate synthase component I [Bacillota bacterium]
MFYPNLEDVRKLSEKFNIIPVCAEYYADTETPISVFKKIESEHYCFLLESVEGSKEMARYSFLGRNPFLTFQSKGDNIKITNADGEVTEYTGDPFSKLREFCEKYRSPSLPELPVFSGGAVGYFGYDTVRRFEKLLNPPHDDLNLPEIHFMFMDEIIAFDHLKQKIIIIVNLHKTGNLQTQYSRAQRRISEIKSELDGFVKKQPAAVQYRDFPVIKSSMTRGEYCDIVKRAKEYIKNGDIFQVVLAQRFSAKISVDPLNVYRAMRVINPSPYMYYLKFDSYQIAGSSPELLVSVKNGVVKTSPIAGSKKRGTTQEIDDALAAELKEDPKENAEHVMLVDLGRNDIGKVSEFGSVRVTNFKYILRFSHIMHMVSDVEGRLCPGKTAFDALSAALPAGTLSGAPKVRAMEIIDEFETVRRGCYGGAISYIGFNGNFDSCITIRTAVFKDKHAYIGAGAGIVYDSVPETEYEETLNKAAAIFKAIEEAGEITD